MRPRSDCMTLERVRQALRSTTRPLTAYDLELIVYLDHRNVRAYLRILKNAGEIHISDWVRSASVGPPTPAWGYGEGKDKSRPTAKSAAQRRRKARKSQDLRDREALIKRALRSKGVMYVDGAPVLNTMDLKKHGA